MRFVLYIFVAILTFAFGVGLTWVSYRLVPVTVPFCEVVQHPTWYQWALVRVEGPARAIYGSAIIYDPSCKAEESAAVIFRDEGFQTSPDVESFLADSNAEVRSAQVLVTGRFDPDATMGCFGPHLGIHASQIELKLPVTLEPRPPR